MKTSYKRKLLDNVNGMLARRGFEIIKKGQEFQDYIPWKQTLLDAE